MSWSLANVGVKGDAKNDSKDVSKDDKVPTPLTVASAVAAASFFGGHLSEKGGAKDDLGGQLSAIHDSWVDGEGSSIEDYKFTASRLIDVLVNKQPPLQKVKNAANFLTDLLMVVDEVCEQKSTIEDPNFFKQCIKVKEKLISLGADASHKTRLVVHKKLQLSG